MGKALRPSLAATADTTGRFPLPIPAVLFETVTKLFTRTKLVARVGSELPTYPPSDQPIGIMSAMGILSPTIR